MKRKPPQGTRKKSRPVQGGKSPRKQALLDRLGWILGKQSAERTQALSEDLMTQNTGRTITQVLRDAIIANNNSYSGLAALSGVDKGQIARFMKGTRDLTLGTADKLAAALGLCFSPSLTLSPEGDESAIDGDLATVNTSGKIPKTGVVPGIIIESKKRSPKGIGKKQAE